MELRKNIKRKKEEEVKKEEERRERGEGVREGEERKNRRGMYPLWLFGRGCIFGSRICFLSEYVKHNLINTVLLLWKVRRLPLSHMADNYSFMFSRGDFSLEFPPS